MFGSRSGTFDRFLERATSQLLLEPDWDSILQICDCVRQEDVQPKYALQAVKKKVNNDNPHVAAFALLVLESTVKNCGSLIHEQVATKEFMEYYKETLQKKPEPVKSKMLELLQVWSHAFRDEPSYKIVQDTFNLLKIEGHKFPVLKESDAMFSAERAPEWKDAEVCSRCRTAFGTFNRKHHCRHCGQVFCSKCSSKNSIIPKFGIEREVRVCDACYDHINKAGDKEGDLPQEYLTSPLAKQSQGPPTKTEQEIQEEEELQLALALSQSEAEAQKQKKGSANYSLYGNSNKAAETVSKPPDPVVTAPTFDTSEMDPELARYLNRNYWQNKSEVVTKVAEVAPTTQPSAPTAVIENKAVVVNNKEEEHYQNGETEPTPGDQKQFLEALNGSIEIFVNRMKSNQSRGRSIANDSAVQTLFMTISQMHPQLLHYIQEQEDVRTHCESLQDKLAQLKDAREALDVLRDEHRDKRRREQEELERQRAIQMALKLEVLRQKKQEYLEYQRQLTLQRMEEQKREMEMRLTHQKQMQMQRAMQYGMVSLPQMYGGQTDVSSMHQPQMMQTPYGAPTQMQMGAPPGAPVGQMQHPGMGQLPMGSLPPGSLGGGVTLPAGVPQTMYGQLPIQQAPPQQGPPSLQQALPPSQQHPHSMMASYQGPPAPGGYVPTPAGYHPGQPQPPSYQQISGGPQQQQQPQPGQQQLPVYTTAPPTSDYSSFNMQNVAASLPSGQYMGGPVISDQYQAHGGPPTQQAPPSQAPPPPQPVQQPQQMAPVLGAPPMGQPGMPHQMPIQAPPSQGQQDVAQLISFD